MENIKYVADDLIYVGADDRKISLFERVYPVTKGMSYNSYLLKDEKTVLFDTADKAVSSKFFENVEFALGGRKLDYIIVQHMEPDHSATLKEILAGYPEAAVLCSSKTLSLFEQFYGSGLAGRAREVKEGDTLSTGVHNLNFISAPMVHWPEVIMTYDSVSGILFSADAFGHFGSLDGKIFADEINFDKTYGDDFRRYYCNIVGKYGPQVQAVLKKLAGKKINKICPLHGYVWRDNFDYPLEKYGKWSAYLPEKEGVAIIYASVYGATENAAEKAAARLNAAGMDTFLADVSEFHTSELLAKCFEYENICFASITYNNGIFSPMEHLLREIAAHNLQNRKVSFIQNGSWAPASAKLMREILENCRNFRFNENILTLKSSVNTVSEEDINTFADSIAEFAKNNF